MPITDTASPDLRLRRRRQIAALAAVTVLGAGVALYAGSGNGQQPPRPAGPPPVPVATTAAEQRDVPHLTEAVGTVQSMQSVLIRAQIDGILTELPFQEGDRVTAGQHLASIDDRTARAALHAAEAQLARDTAQMRSAQLDLSRSTALLERNAASRQTVDQQTAMVDQMRAAIRLAEANVETARINLSYTRISSPVAGRVGIRHVDPGNLVRATDSAGLVTVAQIDPISIVFPMPQDMLVNLKSSAANAGGAVVEAVDRATGKVLSEGSIVAFDNGIDATTGTARVRARFANADDRLTPGQFVSVRVRTGATAGAVVVPAVAVRPGLQGSFVYVVRNGAAERVPVTIGHTDEKIAVIASGVAAGDQIVTDGYSRLKPGAKVSVAPAAAPATAGADGPQQAVR